MRKALAATILATGLTLAPAVDAVHAQEQASEEDDSGNWGLFGLAGLLGLLGLAGLKRRDDRYDTRRDTTTMGSSTVR